MDRKDNSLRQSLWLCAQSLHLLCFSSLFSLPSSPILLPLLNSSLPNVLALYFTVHVLCITILHSYRNTLYRCSACLATFTWYFLLNARILSGYTGAQFYNCSISLFYSHISRTSLEVYRVLEFFELSIISEISLISLVLFYKFS